MVYFCTGEQLSAYRPVVGCWSRQRPEGWQLFPVLGGKRMDYFENVEVVLVWSDTSCADHEECFEASRCDVPEILESCFTNLRQRKDFLCFSGISVGAV